MTQPEDEALVARLRAGDQAAFREVVRLNHGRLVRLAQSFCGSRATAEEVTQEAWLVLLTRFDSYSGQGNLRAWLSGIVVNLARRRAVRDGRMRSFADLVREELAQDRLAAEASRFKANGHWADPPQPWQDLTPEDIVGGQQIGAHLQAALELLPPSQQAVILLREVEGHDAAVVCEMLGVTDGNLRVLLHRGRAAIRKSLEGLLHPGHRNSTATQGTGSDARPHGPRSAAAKR